MERGRGCGQKSINVIEHYTRTIESEKDRKKSEVIQYLTQLHFLVLVIHKVTSNLSRIEANKGREMKNYYYSLAVAKKN